MSGPGGDETVGWPLDDAEAEALLAGSPARRDDLTSLERFLDDLRAPDQGPVPRPSGELAALFSGGLGAGAPDLPIGDPAHAGPAAPAASGRGGSRGRNPVRTLSKVAAATTTAALAVTLAAAAQVLPGSQPKTPLSVSGPATPVRIAGDQRALVGPAQVQAGANATVQQPSTSAVGRTTTTIFRLPPGTDPNALSPDALARLPLEVLRTLTGETLARLPFDVLRSLPGDVLGRLPVDVLRTLPGDALARLSSDDLKTLPGDALARLPLDVLRALPLEALLRLPGEALARLPLELLRGLPTDVQNRLPADVLRLLLLGPPPTATTVATGAARP